jgi:H+/Cl- antiporter ClcA
MRASVRTAKVRRVPGEKTVTASAGSELTPDQAAALISSRRYMALLVLAAIVGLVVSLAAWCFLDGTFQLQQLLFDDIPDSLGYEADPPLWYLLVVLGAGGLIVAYAIARLPGRGGHIPVHGLQAGGPAGPVELPGILLAAVGTIGFGLVLGPEAPLIALGSVVGMVVALSGAFGQREQTVLATAGSFSAISALFGGPIVGGMMMVESGVAMGSALLPVLIPGFVAAAIGYVIFVGFGTWGGLTRRAWPSPTCRRTTGRRSTTFWWRSSSASPRR